MLAKTLWQCTVRRIRGSRAIQILAVICLADYIVYLWLAISGRMGWTSAVVLFIFSLSCWFWAITWPPFWDYLTLPWQGPGTRKTLSFVERIGIVSLFFVQMVYTVILVWYFFLL